MTLLLICTFIVAGSTYANNLNKNNGQGPKFQMTEEMKAIRDQMDTAIQNNDYETWKSLVSKMPQDLKRGHKMEVTEEAFAKMVERYKNRAVMEETQGKIKAAIENGDYATWKSLVSQLPNSSDMLAKITTEDSFLKLVEAHKLIEEGKAKIEEGQAIMEELGLPKPPKPPFVEGRGGRMMEQPEMQEQE